MASGVTFDVDRERLQHLPNVFNMLKRSFWWFRKTVFAKPKPENPAVFVRMTKPEITELFGSHYFEPGWELSYYYQGEDVNLRRVEYRAEGPLSWWQVHIRGYEYPIGFELAAHVEPEPAEHPDAHASGDYIDVEAGNQTLLELLEGHGVDYERIGDWPEATTGEPISLGE